MVCASMALSPNGKGQWLVVGTRRGELFRWDLGQSQPTSTRWQVHGQAAVNHLQFSPDGMSLYSAGEDRMIRRWDLAAQWSQVATHAATSTICQLAVDPRSGKIVYSTDDGMYVLPGDKLEPTDDVDVKPIALSLSPLGETMAVAVSHHVEIRPRASKRILQEMYDDTAHSIFIGDINQLAYNGDGTLVVGGAADDRKVRVWYADSGRLAATVSHAGTGDTRFALSAEGRHLAVTNNMSTAVYQLSNSDVQSFVASSPGIDQIAVSSDLGRIACAAQIQLTSGTGSMGAMCGEPIRKSRDDPCVT